MTTRWSTVAALALIAGAPGCFDEPDFGPSTDTNGAVFLDGFGAGVSYQAFAGSKYDALSIDGTTAHAGQASLKVTVPSATATSGGTYAGGAFVAGDARNLTGYDALSVWAKASRAATLDVAGLGNDNTGTSKFTAQVASLTLATDWTEYVVPIPLPARLTGERGLFFFAASTNGAATGADGGAASSDPYTVWLDDVQLVTAGAGVLGAPSPSIGGGSVTLAPGASHTIDATSATVSVRGASVKVGAMPGYFDFTSSDPSIATVDAAGVVRAVAGGAATISATLGGAPADGALTVHVATPDPGVIALLSGTYPPVVIDKWLADWSMPAGKVAVADGTDGNDPTKIWTDLQYVGVEFFRQSNLIDASSMTTFHVEMHTSDASELHLKLVDFGANGAADPPYDGAPHGDDAQGEVVLGPTSTPALAAKQWVSLDLPLTMFQQAVGQSPGLAHRAHLAQLVVAGAGTSTIASVAVKNVYFHR